MKPLRIEEHIQASPETVFEVLAHIENFQKAVEDIVAIDFVSETKRGVGTVFRETRQMGKRKATVEMEVVGYKPPQSLRIVSRPDSMGTVWDSKFLLEPSGESTHLLLEMTAKSDKIFTRLVNSLFSNMIRKAVTKDMASLRLYCEKN